MRKNGFYKETVVIGNDPPKEDYKMIEANDLEGYTGPVGETGLLIGLSVPLPAPAGQKMGPWAKVDVNVTMPCANNAQSLDKASRFCQKYAEDRLEEILRKILKK